MLVFGVQDYLVDSVLRGFLLVGGLIVKEIEINT